MAKILRWQEVETASTFCLPPFTSRCGCQSRLLRNLYTTYCQTAGLVMSIKSGVNEACKTRLLATAGHITLRQTVAPSNYLSPARILQTTQPYSTQQICSVDRVELGPPHNPVTDVLWAQPLSQHNKQNEHTSLKVINYFTIFSPCSRPFTTGVPFRPHIDSYLRINGSFTNVERPLCLCGNKSPGFVCPFCPEYKSSLSPTLCALALRNVDRGSSRSGAGCSHRHATANDPS